MSPILDYIGAKDDGIQGDNWSCEMCKAPVKSSPPTNQYPAFYKLHALPVAQPTVSKHWRGKVSYSTELFQAQKLKQDEKAKYRTKIAIKTGITSRQLQKKL